MQDEIEFKRKLVRPMVAMVTVLILIAFVAIWVVVWRGSHGRPAWAENVLLWDLLANLTTMVGWAAFVRTCRSRMFGRP